MLAYFHYCNKGSHPFAMDWTIERNIKQAELNPEQLQFLTKTTQLVQGKSALFNHITNSGEFEHDLFFVSQLYDITWQPLRTI
jgi:phosphatidate phosphatase APP1